MLKTLRTPMLTAVSVIALSNLDVTAKAAGQLPLSETFEQYKSAVAIVCNRNRECYFPLEKTVKIRFFITEDGTVRDPRVVVSSGLLSHDLSCIDAVLSASPLPKPPAQRKPLLPPEVPTGVDVDALAAGPMEVDFAPDAAANYRLKEWKDPSHIAIPIIPMKIAEKFPDTFDKQTLMKPDNFFEPDPPGTATFTPEQLEAIRFPWTELYRSSSKITRAKVLSRLDIIQQYFSPVSYETKWKNRWEPQTPIGSKL